MQKLFCLLDRFCKDRFEAKTVFSNQPVNLLRIGFHAFWLILDPKYIEIQPHLEILIRKDAPVPSAFSASIVPFISPKTCLTRYRPRPEPSVVVKPFSKTRDRSVIRWWKPLPLSVTLI